MSLVTETNHIYPSMGKNNKLNNRLCRSHAVQTSRRTLVTKDNLYRVIDEYLTASSSSVYDSFKKQYLLRRLRKWGFPTKGHA